VERLRYHVFDASAYAFPSPRVPFLPTLSAEAIRPSPAGAFALVSEGRPRRSYTRGRYALFDAYRLTGVGPEGGLLAPAYHCRTMLDPAIRLGAPILLYPLEDRLAPDLAQLRRLAQTGRQRIRAMLLTHYFGFPQPVEPVKDFCDTHGIELIEDCSHTLFGAGAGRAGRYVTASPYKLFPSEEGGLLMGRPGAVLPDIRRPGLRAELKTLVNALERSWAHRRHRRSSADVERLDEDIAAIKGERLDRCVSANADVAGTSSMYVAQEEGLSATLASSWIAKCCDISRLAVRRRSHYTAWVDAVRGEPNCRALFDRLPDDVVPYMFPLLIEHPDPHFFLLKELGVPIWRWDDMAVSACGVSERFRDHLLHLPCHQSLSGAELAWMIGAVVKVMRIAPRRVNNQCDG
jgi:hypothetical protein